MDVLFWNLDATMIQYFMRASDGYNDFIMRGGGLLYFQCDAA